MKFFGKVFLSALMFGVWGTIVSAGCNPQLEVCDFPSRAEILKRAKLVPTVVAYRRDLGTQWSKTHERLLEQYSWFDYSCVEKVLVSPRGNFNAALCMPAWMRAVPPDAELTFVRIRSRTQTVIYVISWDDQRKYRYRYLYRY